MDQNKFEDYTSRLEREMNRYKTEVIASGTPYVCKRCGVISRQCARCEGVKSRYQGSLLCPDCLKYEADGDYIELRGKYGVNK